MKDIKEIDFLRLAAMVKIKVDENLGTDSAIFLTGFITGLTWAFEPFCKCNAKENK